MSCACACVHRCELQHVDEGPAQLYGGGRAEGVEGEPAADHVEQPVQRVHSLPLRTRGAPRLHPLQEPVLQVRRRRPGLLHALLRVVAAAQHVGPRGHPGHAQGGAQRHHLRSGDLRAQVRVRVRLRVRVRVREQDFPDFQGGKVCLRTHLSESPSIFPLVSRLCTTYVVHVLNLSAT